LVSLRNRIGGLYLGERNWQMIRHHAGVGRLSLCHGFATRTFDFSIHPK
jgi:hypothetical protein